MPLYEFECPGGHCTTEVRRIERRDDMLRCPQCGLETSRTISLSTPITLATHMRGVRAFDGAGYYDHNLRDRRTGKVPYITSLDQKRALLRSKGACEAGDDMSMPGAQERRDDERMAKKTTFAPRSIDR